MHKEPILKVEAVSKQFFSYDKPVDRLKQMFLSSDNREKKSHIALQDISFDLQRGETLGIIGRNGAGKSTLLQIITGTLTPTSGRVEVRGRISAILELGSSINPEFTGRENIPMQCAIMGVADNDIAGKLDEIISFAGLEDYIDQPVKTYSSGMYMRLAFAIAISVDPDILIVDEALSVGDFMFRNKCMKRIQELRAKGVAILFVSHDLSTLQLLCDRAIWLDHGILRQIGDPVEVSQNYHSAGEDGTVAVAFPSEAPVPQHRTDHALFPTFRLRRGEKAVFETGEDIEFDFTLEAKSELDETVFALAVFRGADDWVLGQTSRDDGVFWPASKKGDQLRGKIVLSKTVLGPGDYGAAIGAYSKDHQICYALTELNVHFKVRTPYPTWGKIIHPIRWVPTEHMPKPALPIT